MQIPDTAIIAAFVAMFGSLVGTITYVRYLHDASAKRCLEENQNLHEIIECLLNDDRKNARILTEAVRQKSRTDVYPALTPNASTRRGRLLSLLPFTLLFIAALILAACGQADPQPRAPEVPAEIEVRDLAQQHIAALEAAIDQESAAAAAAAAGNIPEAEKHRLEAERHRALAAERAKLRQDAAARIAGQQQDMDRRAAAIERQADERAAIKRQAEDDRWIRLIAGGGIFLAIVAGVFLRFAGMPACLATGAPAALAAGCAFLAVWPTIDRSLVEIMRWLLIGAAVVVGLAVLGLLAWAVRWLVHEWRRYADHAAEPGSAERQELDAASRQRQPFVIRWLFDHFFRDPAGSKPTSVVRPA